MALLWYFTLCGLTCYCFARFSSPSPVYCASIFMVYSCVLSSPPVLLRRCDNSLSLSWLLPRGFQSRCSPSSLVPFLVFPSAFLPSFRFAVTHLSLHWLPYSSPCACGALPKKLTPRFRDISTPYLSATVILSRGPPLQPAWTSSSSHRKSPGRKNLYHMLFFCKLASNCILLSELPHCFVVDHFHPSSHERRSVLQRIGKEGGG